MKIWAIILLILILLVAGYFVFFYKNKTKEQGQLNMAEMKVGEAKLTVELADDLSEQIQGLSDRNSLCRDCGMLFIYSEEKVQNFWMRGMHFDLDFLFIRGGKVTEIKENIPAPSVNNPANIVSIQSREQADMVLEVNAGYVKKHGIKVGDVAVLTR